MLPGLMSLWTTPFSRRWFIPATGHTAGRQPSGAGLEQLAPQRSTGRAGEGTSPRAGCAPVGTSVTRGMERTSEDAVGHCPRAPPPCSRTASQSRSARRNPQASPGRRPLTPSPCGAAIPDGSAHPSCLASARRVPPALRGPQPAASPPWHGDPRAHPRTAAR